MIVITPVQQNSHLPVICAGHVKEGSVLNFVAQSQCNFYDFLRCSNCWDWVGHQVTGWPGDWGLELAREGTGPQFAVWRLEALAATHSRWLGLQSVPQWSNPDGSWWCLFLAFGLCHCEVQQSRHGLYPRLDNAISLTFIDHAFERSQDWNHTEVLGGTPNNTHLPFGPLFPGPGGSNMAFVKRMNETKSRPFSLYIPYHIFNRITPNKP